VEKKGGEMRRLLVLPFWVWAALGIVLTVVAYGALSLPRFTTAATPVGSAFCLTCHGTKETPDKSKASLVHPSYFQVGCADCHATHGQFPIAEGYRGGFQAERGAVDANCRRCHASMAQTNEQVGFKFNEYDIKIPHQFHLQIGAQCTDCHRNIAHDLREQPTNRPRMDYCFECHVTKESQTCSKCHASSIPQAQQRVSITDPAPARVDGKALYGQYCQSCHGEKGDLLPAANLCSAAFLTGRGDEALVKAIAEGRGGMPPFGKAKGGMLGDEQVQALVEYLKSQGR